MEFSSSFIRKGFLHLHFNLLTPRSLPENEDGQLSRHHSSSNGEWSWVEHHAWAYSAWASWLEASLEAEIDGPHGDSFSFNLHFSSLLAKISLQPRGRTKRRCDGSTAGSSSLARGVWRVPCAPELVWRTPEGMTEEPAQKPSVHHVEIQSKLVSLFLCTFILLSSPPHYKNSIVGRKSLVHSGLLYKYRWTSMGIFIQYLNLDLL